MDHILKIVVYVPSWIWPLLAVLLWIGLRAGHTRMVRVWQIWILPITIFIVSLTTIVSINLNTASLFSWLFGILAGCGLGWGFHQDENLRADRKHGLLQIKGEWKTLILIIVVFVYQYYWAYKTATAPELVSIPGVILSYTGFNGILTGLFFGWCLHSLNVYRFAISEDLKNPIEETPNIKE
tara:strand:+ start:1872 stop:2417 length:546 start_codon:yes stop_codon:yes gene_type:complete